jgi:hypothetical protein
MDRLLEFLQGLGIEPVDGHYQSIVFEDAIINVYVDDSGKNRIDINPIDEQFIFTDHCLDDFFDDYNRENEWEEERLINDDEDEDEYDEGMLIFSSNLKTAQFEIGEIVKVKGYEGRAFQIQGYMSKYTWEYGEESQEFIYDLTDTNGGEFIEAFEEDISLYNQKPTKARTQINGAIRNIADELLDHYNTCKFLYETFKDQKHKDEMDRALEELKKIKL